jgi:DNA-binding NarL/FixJ family response regulator
VERLAERVDASRTEWGRGLLARARALTATGLDADGHFCAALDELSRTSVATDRARTQLLHGEWLRFAARARGELAATGVHLRPRSAPVDLLTPQEAQIARLAAAGERNQDIAAQLFITVSTVEYHLRKVFVKLGVTSRTQLAQIPLPS